MYKRLKNMQARKASLVKDLDAILAVKEEREHTEEELARPSNTIQVTIDSDGRLGGWTYTGDFQ